MNVNDTELPPGFSLVRSFPDELVITYKSTGMGCLLTFLVVVTVGLTGGLAFFEATEPGAIRVLVFAEWWTPLAFIGGVSAIVYYSCFVIFHIFGTTTFSVTDRALLIKRSLFGLSRSRQFRRDEIQCLEQIKDGGGSNDSFPTWGLRVVARRKHWLLKRQPIDKSDWLGQFLAERLAVDYKPSEKRG